MASSVDQTFAVIGTPSSTTHYQCLECGATITVVLAPHGQGWPRTHSTPIPADGRELHVQWHADHR